MGKADGIVGALTTAGNAPGAGGDSTPVDPIETLQEELFGSSVLTEAASLRKATTWQPAAKRAKRGRPPGAKSRKTKEMLALFDKMGKRDPLVNAQALVDDNPTNIAKALGCNIDKAIDLWRWANEFIASFKHGKAPVSVNVQNVPSVPIQWHDGKTIDQGKSKGYTPLAPEVTQTQGHTNDTTH